MGKRLLYAIDAVFRPLPKRRGCEHDGSLIAFTASSSMALAALDVNLLELILNRLQHVDIVSLFGMCCVDSGLQEAVGQWLGQQTDLYIDMLPAHRQDRWQLLAMSKVVRLRLPQVATVW